MEERFLLFLKEYHAVYPLTEPEVRFIKEAYRLLKPSGRLVIADGFVTDFKNNDESVIRQWLDGWQVNYSSG